MTPMLAQLGAMLLLILVAAELFTNALEQLGERLGISEGVTGSLFAAVGTALPETMVPLLALAAGGSDVRVNQEIGAGAILGAPLMLSTLSTFLMACAVLPRRGWRGSVRPEPGGLRRDLNFFLGAFLVATAAMFVPPSLPTLRAGLGLLLVPAYFVYSLLTVRASQALVADGHGTTAGGRLWLGRLGLPAGLPLVLVQLVLGVGVLLVGARGFIDGVAGTARAVGVSALLISLLLIPIATELPEKVNSIRWIRRDKDTLALGNITGALVFQGTLLPAIGILATPWLPRPEVLAGALLTLASGFWLRWLARKPALPLAALCVQGLLYVGYLVLALRLGRA